MKESKKIKKISLKVGKAIFDYKLLQKDDKVLVAVSGGKDSLTLLDILTEKRRTFPFKFELHAVIVNFNNLFQDEYLVKLENYLSSVNVSYKIIEQKMPDTSKKFNCFWCSWNRRKEIFMYAGQLRCTKIAFGHNLDDIVSTLLMNMFFHAEISSMPVKLEMFKGEFTLIRPLLYLQQQETEFYAKVKNLPVIENLCPVGNSKINNVYRTHISKILNEISAKWPNVKLNILNSMKNIRNDYIL